jgi:hypothetical protein
VNGGEIHLLARRCATFPSGRKNRKKRLHLRIILVYDANHSYLDRNIRQIEDTLQPASRIG